jgi:hypothetical protein
MSDLTYSRLDEMLRGLGFAVRPFDANTKSYKHADTGAILLLPNRPDQLVTPHHLVATRTTLDAFGIASPPELAAQPQAS